MSQDTGKRKPTVSSTVRKPKKKARFGIKDLEDEPTSKSERSITTESIDKTTVLSRSTGRTSVLHSEKVVALTAEEILWLENTAEMPDTILDPTAPSDADIRGLIDALPTSAAEDLEPDSTSGRKKRARPELRAASKIRNWLPFRSNFLDELLRYEGCTESLEDGAEANLRCPGCQNGPAIARCTRSDCMLGRALYCEACVRASHAKLPLHCIEVWNGKFFLRTALRELGLKVQVGHSGGELCPTPGPSRTIVLGDISGIHKICIHFCGCQGAPEEWKQLFRQGWYPATTDHPSTAFTFELLNLFQELNLQGKLSLYDFWKGLERATDNSGCAEVPDRYKQLSHVMRCWRNLMMLKRAGRAHDPSGVEGTQEGELALDCPACPHPGKNLPSDWKTVPATKRWLYTLYLMIDANFRARCKDRGLDDIDLAPGWSYFVESTKYKAHLVKHGKVKEENTCSAEHKAIINATVRRDGYIASGVGAVLCARHALVRKNGAGDLQLGEGYANMDYLVFSTLLGIIIMILLFSYDIACQWSKRFWIRAKQFPATMQLSSTIKDVRFAIPKKHFRVHGPNHSKFSLNFLSRVGRTYGEGIEAHWSHMNPVALSAREMAVSARHELLDYHWGGWNWRKIISFGPHLLRSFHEARLMNVKQRRAFSQFSGTFRPEIVEKWSKMLEAWEADPTKPDPYEEPASVIKLKTVRLELATEEARESAAGTLPAHEVTPAVFLQVGLELEEIQRALRLRKSQRENDGTLADLQEKRTLLVRRIELWQGIQDVHMPVVTQLRDNDQPSGTGPPPANTTDTPHASSASSVDTGPVLTASQNAEGAATSHPSGPILAEHIKLWLPSELPEHHATLPAFASLRDKERRLRLAQASDALDDIRRLRRVLTGVSQFKKLNVSGTGQRANTRIRNLYSRFQNKIDRAAVRYRAARAALESLDKGGSWSTQFQVLLDADIRGPGKDDAEESEGRYVASWIWLASSRLACSDDPKDPTNAAEFAESMRVEWAKSKARADRWLEEEELLLEEMRRVLSYFGWRATWWRQQGHRRPDADIVLQRGLAAYAEKQAAVFEGLIQVCASYWVPYLRLCGPLPDWASQFADITPRRRRGEYRTTPTSQRLAQDELDDEVSDVEEDEEEVGEEDSQESIVGDGMDGEDIISDIDV